MNILIVGIVFIGLIVLFCVILGLVLRKHWRFRVLRKSYGWAHFLRKEGLNYWQIFKTPFVFGAKTISYKGITYPVSFSSTDFEGVKTDEDLKKENKKEKVMEEPAQAIFDKNKRPNIYFELGKTEPIQFGSNKSKFRSSGKILNDVLDSTFVSRIFRAKTEKLLFALVVILAVGLIISMILNVYIANQPPIIILENGTMINTPPIKPPVVT